MDFELQPLAEETELQPLGEDTAVPAEEDFYQDLQTQQNIEVNIESN